MIHPYFQSFIGGLAIGVAVWLLFAGIGRVAGVSGITASALTSRLDRGWRLAFLGGLVIGGALFSWLLNVKVATESSPIVLIVAGLLVGIGTVLGSGCTSGHGVCGLARASKRSIIATLTFMASGIVTVLALRILS